MAISYEWLSQAKLSFLRHPLIEFHLEQKAEQILSYSMTLASDPKFPVLSSDSLVVDQTRQVLLSVVRGMPARDRVYNELKMRAAVRYPALTIKQMLGDANQNAILGSYALPGMFTHAAWSETARNAMLYLLQGTVDNPINLEEHAFCTKAPT